MDVKKPASDTDTQNVNTCPPTCLLLASLAAELAVCKSFDIFSIAGR